MESQERFDLLYKTVNANPKAKYKLCFNTEDIDAIFDTAYETDNSLEIDDPDYEELWALLFISSERAIELTYHSLPEHVYCDDKCVY